MRLPLLVEVAERAVEEDDDDELELPLPLSRTERTTLPLDVELLPLRSTVPVLPEVVLRLTLHPLLELPEVELRLT